MSTSFLFSPSAVERVLANKPALKEALPGPTREGVASVAFPALRKTNREVYRWIANTHYDHLADSVMMLERVLVAGCRFSGLLTTRSRAQFIGYTGELLVADELIRRGYTVTTVPRSAEAAPDLYVVGAGIDVAIEVYTPRELRAVDERVEEAKDLVDQVALPMNFRSRLETRIDPTVPWPKRPDPWEVDRMLARSRDEVLDAIATDVRNHLLALGVKHRQTLTLGSGTYDVSPVTEGQSFAELDIGAVKLLSGPGT